MTSYIILLYPDDDDDRAYVCNITPWSTPHSVTSVMLIKVFCVVSMLSKLPPVVCLRGATGLLNKGGGSNRLPVEFPQVQTSYNNIITINKDFKGSSVNGHGFPMHQTFQFFSKEPAKVET